MFPPLTWAPTRALDKPTSLKLVPVLRTTANGPRQLLLVLPRPGCGVARAPRRTAKRALQLVILGHTYAPVAAQQAAQREAAATREHGYGEQEQRGHRHHGRGEHARCGRDTVSSGERRGARRICHNLPTSVGSQLERVEQRGWRRRAGLRGRDRTVSVAQHEHRRRRCGDAN
eukprot:scaffold12816_cov64-Phaeocystis_antarctica.AAC.5